MKQKIFQLREQGYSYNMIQKELGCSKSTINYYLAPDGKEKVMERTRHKRREQKDKIRQYKEAVGCTDCKQKFPHYILEFDHLPGVEKIGSPTDVSRTYSWAKAVEEIDKCEVVCANCHNTRTWKRSNEE